ncbi:MAG: DUF938 domain-containing protein [Proteobacteria bacterium]|nr:DUF938 domain-containing protein [Pseudomonadota bacterium]
MSQTNDLPFSQSCENNKQPILTQLERLLADAKHVLEVAGGTGQHAAYFAEALPQLRWQSSDIQSALAGLNSRIESLKLDNLPAALALDVDQQSWLLGTWPTAPAQRTEPTQGEKALSAGEQFEKAIYDRLGKNAAINAGPFDALFSANSLHIMSEGSVANFFLGAGKLLAKDALLIVYGPFNYAGKFISQSNEEFDRWLKERNPVSGIRDFEAVCTIADIANFEFEQDIEMPANNRLLVWRKRAAE